jgi:Family of unknown function (DUF6308)
MQLTLGAAQLDLVIDDPAALLIAFRKDEGIHYLNHRPSTPPDRVCPEDMAITVHVNSVWNIGAFKSCLKSIEANAAAVDLCSLPDKALEETTPQDRQHVAKLIATVASWNWFAASTATKLLHKKRPALIPILDNMAIFGAYMHKDWPKQRSLQFSIKDAPTIGKALDWISYDLNRMENREVWPALKAIEPTRSLIELFDMVWWMCFRSVEDPKGNLKVVSHLTSLRP